MNKPYEPRANSDIQVDSSLPTNNGTPNMALTCKGMDDKSCSSWLSLDSSRSENPIISKGMLQQVTTGEGSASRNSTIGKAVAGEGLTFDIVQQPSLDPHTTRNPRKRRRKSNANTGLTVEKSNRDGNGEDGSLKFPGKSSVNQIC